MNNKENVDKNQVNNETNNENNVVDSINPFKPLPTKLVTESYHGDESATVINESISSKTEKRGK